MLSVEIKINGILMGHLYMHRLSFYETTAQLNELKEDNDPRYRTYTCFYSRVDGHFTKEFYVENHDPDQGFEALVSEALSYVTVKENETRNSSWIAWGA